MVFDQDEESNHPQEHQSSLIIDFFDILIGFNLSIEADCIRFFGFEFVIATMFARSLRASKAFTIFVVSVAIFTDILLQNLIIPVLPFALRTRVGFQNEAQVQQWTAILLAASWAALTIGSRG